MGGLGVMCSCVHTFVCQHKACKNCSKPAAACEKETREREIREREREKET
jgi:hypothetical protein